MSFRLVREFIMAAACALTLAGSAHGGPQYYKLPERYADLYAHILSSQGAAPRLNANERLGLSAIACRLWKLDPTSALKSQAVQLLGLALADPSLNLNDFHNVQILGQHLLLMKSAGLITPELRAAIARTLRQHFASTEFQKWLRNPGEPAGNNITLAQFYGHAALLRYGDGVDLPSKDALVKAITAQFDANLATGDLDEDASNYDSLGLAHFIDLARVLGREQDLKRFRRVFERMRDIVSPTGLIPEYGDGYFSYTGCPLDRVYLLEYAAKLFGDPSYRYAARKIYERPVTGLPAVDFWERALPLINLELLDAAPTAASASSPQRSTVMYRRNYSRTRDDIDKLILRTGLEPGSAMIMIDVYASGSHAHEEKGPSVAYYEAAGVPLFHNLGRHGVRSSNTGNLLWFMPAGEAFPGFFNKPDVWHTMSIPVDYLAPGADGKRYVAKSLFLRDFPEYNHKTEYLFFDNLRLSGPGGEKLIDDFEEASGKGFGWSEPALKSALAAASPDHTQGSYSQRLAWSMISASPTRIFPPQLHDPQEPVDETKYTHLKLDLKYLGQRPYMHIRGLGRQVDLGDELLEARAMSASVQQRGRDAYGQIEYDSYVERDTQVTRRLVLTSEGYLVIQDEITAGRSADGWTAGQLWQLYEMEAQGENWFLSATDGAYPLTVEPDGAKAERRMLVRFAAGEGTKAAIEKVERTYWSPAPNGRHPNRFFTAFSQRRVSAGSKATFTMIVVPQDPAGLPPSDFSSRVQIRQESGGRAIAEVAGEQTVRISIGAGDWEVTR
jgi:hypothetical protein